MTSGNSAASNLGWQPDEAQIDDTNCKRETSAGSEPAICHQFGRNSNDDHSSGDGRGGRVDVGELWTGLLTRTGVEGFSQLTTKGHAVGRLTWPQETPEMERILAHQDTTMPRHPLPEFAPCDDDSTERARTAQRIDRAKLLVDLYAGIPEGGETAQIDAMFRQYYDDDELIVRHLPIKLASHCMFTLYRGKK